MENSFLHKVASHLLSQFGPGLSSCQVIFPNKRPEGYFRQALADATEYPLISPAVFSIEEFITQNASGMKAAEPLDLLFTLYGVYLQYEPEESFDDFFNWGNMLLGDYDELDRYMVDTSKFFSNLASVKEIEKMVGGEEDALQFWRSLDTKNPQELQKRFIQLWEVFESVYYNFGSALQQQGMAYAGMLYREAAKNILKGEYDTQVKKYIFIGFNALTKAEEIIIKKLLDDEMALIFWDVDDYYLYQHPREEAGHFIRKSISRLGIAKPLFVSDVLGKESKEIHIVSVPLQVGQARSLGSEINDIIRKTGKVPGKESVILMPDENLLLPVLNSLPSEITELNVTTGYPLAETPLNTLFENLHSLYDTYDPATNGYYFKDVLGVLAHPYLSSRDDKNIMELVQKIESRQWIYIHGNEFLQFENDEILKIIFQKPKDVQSLISVFHYLLEDIEKHTFNLQNADESFIDEFKGIVSKLESFFRRQTMPVTTATCWRFFRQMVRLKKIALSADKPESFQLMGTLETRCLDFETVFVLSMNEGTLPKRQNNHSYIPYDLRKGFGLPTSDEQDYLYAYYFYRLIQRAGTVYLFYNGEAGTAGNEKSRYLRQIETFLAARNPKITIHYKSNTLPLKSYQPIPIIIEKDEAYFEGLRPRYEEKGLSPSLISSYYVCPLQFMLKYVSQLEEKEEISEELEANRFGTIYHAVMEGVYKDYEGQEVSADVIKSQKGKIEFLLMNALRSLNLEKEYITNKNSLLLETIKVLVQKTLEEDEAYAPFKILNMEHKLQHNLALNRGSFGDVKLQGTIDRVDEKDGLVRIIDYKTGMTQKFNFDYDNEEENLTKTNKEAFQTLFYAYLFHKNTGAGQIQPTILPLKKVNEGYKTVNAAQGPLSSAALDNFEVKLKDIVWNILDAGQPIQQIEDDAVTCGYCSYSTLCMR